MNRSRDWKGLVLTGLAVCLLPTAAAADDDPLLDLELSNVQVEVFEDRSETFQILPVITLRNAGDLASHDLHVALYYVPVGVRALFDTVEYVQVNHDCWQQPVSECGGGRCEDILLSLGRAQGFCDHCGFLSDCGCLYILELAFEPLPYTLGYNSVLVSVDPYNLVPEADETNNTMIIDLGPIANDFVTWSGIKSMYR
ncbi:hypothetical protein H8E07_22515 [bacterium]|nr:hypothetical protein [bacterium]